MKADLFFAPDPPVADAPSPETFDLEVDNDKEVEDFDLELSFKQFDDFFATFRDTIPVAPTPSVVTHSTESAYEVSSQYSCDFTLSDYSLPSEIESPGSVNDGLYSAHASQYSCDLTLSDYSIPSKIESPGSVNDVLYSTHASVYPTAFSNSPSIPPPSPAKAVPVQESATAALSAAVHVVLDEAHGPVKPFKCPLCPFCESDARDFIIGSL